MAEEKKKKRKTKLEEKGNGKPLDEILSNMTAGKYELIVKAANEFREARKKEKKRDDRHLMEDVLETVVDRDKKKK